MSAGSHDDDFDTRAGRRAAPRLDAEPNFGPRYKVLAKVGEGGMGEVFRAYDAELKGEVALKVVRADKDDELAAFERFRREVALARKVTSPNVLRVYDLDDHDGLRFLSMEFVEGSDLAAVMRNGRLSIERALAIFRQICAGLAAAHEQGVVHRDLKPQNVLVDREDHVKVADFGLARSVGDSGMTATGAVLGSPAYMAPEQVKGEPTDERSDIYSLGIILYQLISGETPFRGGTPHAVMEMRLHKAPKPLHELEPTTPRAVDAVAAKCLALNPAARYATIKALLADLDAPLAKTSRARWIVPVAGVGVAVVVATAVTFAVSGSGSRAPSSAATAGPGSASLVTPPATGSTPTLVVLDSDNRTNEPMLDHTLDLVMSNELRGSPILDPSFGIRAHDLVAEFSQQGTIDDESGRKLAEREHCRVLLGTIVSATDGVDYKISIAVHDVADGHKLIDRTVSVPKSRIVPAVVRAARELRRAVGETNAPLDEDNPKPMGTSPDLDADHELALGRALLTTQDDQGAVTHFQRSLAIDPSCVEALRGLAVAYYNIGRITESAQQQRAALKLSDQLNDRDRLLFLGDYNNITTGEYDRAVAEYTEVLRKWPSDPVAAGNLANVYVTVHDIARAIAAGRADVRMHPRESISLFNLAGYEILANDLDGATKDLDSLSASFHHVPPAEFEYRAIIAALRGNFVEADSMISKIANEDPSRADATAADLLLARAQLAAAMKVLERGIAADHARGNDDGVEAKQAVLAETLMRQGKKSAALAVAGKVHKEMTRQFLAALVQLAEGDLADPAATAERLSREAPPGPRALGLLLVGESKRIAGKPVEAETEIRASIALDNGWYAHLLLARALFDQHKLAEADAELAICLQRRAEGAIVFTDDVATVRLLPLLTYWRARTFEAERKPEAKTTYAQFLAGQSTADRDPLVVDAQKRMAALH